MMQFLKVGNFLIYVLIFFNNAVKNLNITVSGNILCEVNNMKNPVLKAIEKYKKHPSIKAVLGISKNDNFILEKVFYEEILHKTKQLDTRKTCQGTELPSKIIKMNSYIFSRKVTKTVKLIIGLSVLFQTFIRFMKDVFINKCKSFLIK